MSELPEGHAEKWQLARYGVQAEYKPHTDTIPAFNDLQPGGRFSTLLLYLDGACEGGCTEFPDLGLQVRPEVGASQCVFPRRASRRLL